MKIYRMILTVIIACFIAQNALCRGKTHFTNNSDITVYVKQQIGGGTDTYPNQGQGVKPGESKQWEAKSEIGTGSSQGIRVYSDKNHNNGLDHYIFCKQPNRMTEESLASDNKDATIWWTFEGKKGTPRTIGDRGTSGQCSKSGYSDYEILVDDATKGRIESQSNGG